MTANADMTPDYDIETFYAGLVEHGLIVPVRDEPLVERLDVVGGGRGHLIDSYSSL